MKTNKSLTKRLKITKNGKILARKGGQNHFNAKESRRNQLNDKAWQPLTLNNKNKSRYLANQF
jgi:ribosomal protein L35